MDIGETLYVTDVKQWRAWLRKNHARAKDIWLIYYTRQSGKPSLPYNDAVDEAICWGWIDSILKKHGPDSRAQRFSPRRKGSPLSEMNKVRARRMVQQKRMTKAGLESVAEILDEPFTLPPDIEQALRADPDTWRNYQTFPDSYQRIRVGWIDGSRNNQQVFDQRLKYFLRMTKHNKRFGMVQ